MVEQNYVGTHRQLSFFPCPGRQWHAVADGPSTVRVTGWADTGSGIRSGESLGSFVLDRLRAARAFADILRDLNGNFAVVADTPEGIHLGVDAVRSIPLYYAVEGNSLKVSDDLRSINSGGGTIDRESAIEYATAGYVTGPHTLFQGITGLQSGECLSWRPGDRCPVTRRYYQYRCTYDATASVDDLCRELDDTLLATFRRTIESLDGRQAAIPLSGGLDSRLVASLFKRCGYENVLCFSYGAPGNRESARSQAVAATLGYPWQQIAYSPSRWKQEIASPAMREYWSFSANGVSVPHCDEWPALRSLSDCRELSPEAVFVPGHTGDFISGGHLTYLYESPEDGLPPSFDAAMVHKHYSLWEDLVRVPGVRAVIQRRLRETVGDFPEATDRDLALKYEYWEWQERQAKLIINAVRAYEFFGFDWRIPLWDREIMDFWKRVPLALKLDKHLYRTGLASHDPWGLFQDAAPGGPPPAVPAFHQRESDAGSGPKASLKSSVKASVRRSRPVAALRRRRAKHRRYLYQYRDHPLRLGSAFGLLRYLFREPTKRNALALLQKEFLQSEYGLRISALASEYHDRAAGDRQTGQPTG